MERKRDTGAFYGVALAIALGGCGNRPAATASTYFEASMGEPSVERAPPSVASSIARYAAVVEAMPETETRLDTAAEALDELAVVVATLPGAANAAGAEEIRGHARQLRQDADDPPAARHEIGLALAVAANAFDAVARVTYTHDAVLGRAVADFWSDVDSVVSDDTPSDPAHVHRALFGAGRVLWAYEKARSGR